MAGSATPPAAEALVDAPATTLAPHRLSDTPLLFMTRKPLEHLSFPVVGYPNTAGAGLESVTLDPMGTAQDMLATRASRA